MCHRHPRTTSGMREGGHVDGCVWRRGAREDHRRARGAAVRRRDRHVRRDVGLPRRPAGPVSRAARRRPGDLRRAGLTGRDRRALRPRVARAAGDDRVPRRRRRRGRRGRPALRPPRRLGGAAPRPGQPVVDRPARPVRRRLRQGHPGRPRGVPDRRRRRLDGLRRRHDRGPGRLQPALAPRPSRHRDPAGAAGHPRPALGRSRRPASRTSPAASAGPRSRSPLPIRTSTSTASTSTRPRSSSPGRTPARPASRTG